MGVILRMDKKRFEDWLSKKRAPRPVPRPVPVLPVTIDLRDYAATVISLGIVALSSRMDEDGHVIVTAKPKGA
jgi:hypothetical protein